MTLVQLPYNENPTSDDRVVSSRRGRPFLFQIIAPGTNEPIYEHLLALHTNPASVEEKMTKGKTVVPTYGGFVEFVWPDDFDSVSCSHSTGAFISANPSGGGLTSNRRTTIAWERQEDLLELFHNNGMVFDSHGAPAIRGHVMMIYDRGIYIGYFTSFQVTEDDTHAFSFELSWEFKVEQVLYRFPNNSSGSGV